MADITRTTPGPANADVEPESPSARVCATDLAAGDVCTVNSSGQLVKWGNGDAGLPKCIIPAAQLSGEYRTGHRRGNYGGFTGLTPGALLYTSANDGQIANAAATGSFVIGYCLTSTSIFLDFGAILGQVASA